MPQTTAKGVPYVVGSDVAGAYPETSVNLANYINDRMVQKSGDTMTGSLALSSPGSIGVKMFGPSNGWSQFNDVAASGAFTLAEVNPADQVQGVVFQVAPGSRVVTFGTQLRATGLAEMPGQTSAAHSWLVRRDSTGEIKTIPDTVFRLIVAAVGQTSTRRLKTKIGAGAAPDVTRLAPKAYTWTDEAGFGASSPGPRFGLIAEEAAEVDPRLTTVDPETGQPAGLDSHALIAALVAKVQQLQTRLETLERATP